METTKINFTTEKEMNEAIEKAKAECITRGFKVINTLSSYGYVEYRIK